MSTLYIFALLNLALCVGIFAIALCRLNSMEGTVLLRVRSEYTALLAGAVASGLQPWYGEWPGWGALSLASAVLVALICSGHAWHRGQQDKPPEIAKGRPTAAPAVNET